MLFTPSIQTHEAVRSAALAASARALELGFFSDRSASSGQQAYPSSHTDVRTAPGWLSVRLPQIFMAGRTKSLGTGFLALFETMVRAAPGWLSARPSASFLFGIPAGSGQHVGFSTLTDVRTAPGWLSVRRLIRSLAGRMEYSRVLLHPLFETMDRAASGVLSARPSTDFPSKQDSWLGTAGCPVVQVDACAASGWLSAQNFVSFSEAIPYSHYHLPVFPAEIGEWMAAREGKFIIDGTLGGGGHSEIFLKAGARVLGIDRDPEALSHARARLAAYGERFSTWEGNFSHLPEIPEIQRGERADGLLMDLGVSSRQLDSAERGFSFMREGPLDMRMGPSSPRTAAEIVNHWPEVDIVKILFEFGEESKARRIAGAIVRQRAIKPFVTTLDLANFLEKTLGRHGRTHPATKTFQAIRMAVNEELESLATALSNASSALKPGGRLLIITFHSLEDRMVKRFLRHRSTEWIDDPGWPEPRPNPDYQYRLLARKAIIPNAEEISLNPRARSAKLRVAELLAPKS